MTNDDLPTVRSCERAPVGTLLELASYEELISEIRHRRPTAAVVAVAYPTAKPGYEHSGKIDVITLAGGEVAVIDQLCWMAAQRAALLLELGGGWDHG